MSDVPDLTTRVGLLEHRVEAIRVALEETALRDDVRRVLQEHLIVAEQSLNHARGRTLAGEELQYDYIDGPVDFHVQSYGQDVKEGRENPLVRNPGDICNPNILPLK